MRAVLILVIIGLLMIFAGWLTIVKTGDQTSINIETRKIERDTERAIDRGRDALHDVERGGRRQPDEVISVPQTSQQPSQ